MPLGLRKNKYESLCYKNKTPQRHYYLPLHPKNCPRHIFNNNNRKKDIRNRISKRYFYYQLIHIKN